MLASIIANLQNVEPIRPAKLPVVKIDRGGGVGPGWPNYDIVDITTAIQLFPEIVGEDSFTRTVRRLRWIGEALPRIKEARERRDGAVFLAGAVVGDAAAEERHKEAEAATAARYEAAEAAAEERRRLVDQLKVEQIVEIIDEVRGVSVAPVLAAPQRASRGQNGGAGASMVLAAIGISVAIGVVWASSSSPKRGRKRRS